MSIVIKIQSRKDAIPRQRFNVVSTSGLFGSVEHPYMGTCNPSNPLARILWTRYPAKTRLIVGSDPRIHPIGGFGGQSKITSPIIEAIAVNMVYDHTIKRAQKYAVQVEKTSRPLFVTTCVSRGSNVAVYAPSIGGGNFDIVDVNSSHNPIGDVHNSLIWGDNFNFIEGAESHAGDFKYAPFSTNPATESKSLHLPTWHIKAFAAAFACSIWGIIAVHSDRLLHRPIGVSRLRGLPSRWGISRALILSHYTPGGA